VLARKGRLEEAEALVREALAVLEETDAVLFRYGAFLDLAEVIRLSGRDPSSALEKARTLAEAKGSPVLADAAAARLIAAPGG
jgi:hypothetical protein